MRNRDSRISIGKDTAASREDDPDELNESEDLDDEVPTTGKAYLKKSIFPNRPATVFFSYPKCVGL